MFFIRGEERAIKIEQLYREVEDKEKEFTEIELEYRRYFIGLT